MKSTSSQPTQYPLATIACYGPDNRTATKLVVGIVRGPGQGEPDPMHRWFKPHGGVDQDPAIVAEIAAFIKQHGVKHSVTCDRILGCPHEEGVDYPEGETCPHCPFWKDVDRFTHEPKSKPKPPPALTVEQILAELSVEQSTHPVRAIVAADPHRAALIEPLLKALDRGVADPTELPGGEAVLFRFAICLLAKWRERRAHPLIISWLSLPGRKAFDLGGDLVTELGGRVLAMTCGGQTDSIKALIVNREASGYCRGQAVQALACLAAWGELPHDECEAYFLWLAREGLEREGNHAWCNLAAACVEIEALSVFDDLRRAYDDGLIDSMFIRAETLDEVERRPRGSNISLFKENSPPITDVVQETSWWACFSRDRAANVERMAEWINGPRRILKETDKPKPPYVAPPKVGRNDPCTCGSGKKFKKCCGG